jgi:hypothetical protein
MANLLSKVKKITRAQVAVILLAVGTIIQNPEDVHTIIGAIGTVIAAFTGPQKKE